MSEAEYTYYIQLYSTGTTGDPASLHWPHRDLKPERIENKNTKKTDILEIACLAPPPSRIYDPTHHFLKFFVFISHFCQAGKAVAHFAYAYQIKKRKKKC